MRHIAGSIPGALVAGLLLATSLAPRVAAQDADEPEEPFDVGLREEVEVQLVLVEARVLDGDERTVPDLAADDFLLLVNGKSMPIATFDVDCPLGATDDIRPGKRSAPLPVFESEQDRRIVLVFDYFHMENASDALGAALDGLERWPAGGEEQMVVSLGQVLRIEEPFTKDPEQVRLALTRMRTDRALFAGAYDRLTERKFFERFSVLLDVLERVPGRKMIVLFSGPFDQDGFAHDNEHAALASMAARARAAVYPVDTAGLRTPLDPGYSGLGGPRRLRRIANETGGRMTSDTNDIAVAYARARRDLGCSYTLGFYDTRPRLDRNRRVTVRVPGLGRGRVAHPDSYVVRSREERSWSLARAASMAPEFFAGDGLDASLVLLGPAGPEKWDALLAVDVRPQAGAGPAADVEWILRGYVRKPSGTLVHGFKRRFAFLPGEPETRQVFEPMTVRPGQYVFTAVVSARGGDEPLATHQEIEVGSVPADRWFLLGPILGRQAGDVGGDVTRGRSDDAEPAFWPLVLDETEAGQPLVALTRACRVRVGRGGDETGPVGVGVGAGPVVERRLLAADGSTARTFESARVELRTEPKASCQDIVDILDTGSLDAGHYRLEVFASSDAATSDAGSVEFDVRPARH